MAKFQNVAARYIYEQYSNSKIRTIKYFITPISGVGFFENWRSPPPQSFDVRGDLWLYTCLASLRVHPVQMAWMSDDFDAHSDFLYIFGLHTPPFGALWGTTLQLDLAIFFFHIYSISATTYQKLDFIIYLKYFVNPIPLIAKLNFYYIFYFAYGFTFFYFNFFYKKSFKLQK